MKKYLKLFLVFLKIGAITFGGGLAMFPIMQREIVDKNHWVTSEDIMDFFAISQTIPGIMAANVAVMVGNRVKKFWGGLFAVLGVIIPSIIVIIVVATVLDRFNEIPIVQHALTGINISVLVMLFGMVVNLKKNIFDIITLLIAIAGFVLITILGVSPTFPIIGSAVLGILIYRNKAIKQ